MKLQDLCEPPLDAPPLDMPGTVAVSNHQRHWQEHGYVILPKFMDASMIDRYCHDRERANGWESLATPYMVVPSLKELCLWAPLSVVLESLIGEPAGLHLNLCNWTSTERDWHQDIYLNPPHVKGRYLAVWFALDDIQPDAGPFEYVPGSHRWGYLSMQKVINEMLRRGMCDQAAVNTGRWPWNSENLLTPLVEQEILERGAKIERFIAKKGDVLIWHGQLSHRGSRPERPGAERRSVIAHYSGIYHRPDMPAAQLKAGSGWYFPIRTEQRHPMKPS